jgi:hypothetical protein
MHDPTRDTYSGSFVTRNWNVITNTAPQPFRWNTSGGITAGQFGGSGYDPISPVSQGMKGTDSRYTVRDGDTLQGIAASVWGDASLWYMIAEANGLSGSESLAAGSSLIVPDKVVNLHNSSKTFEVYDPNRALGDLLGARRWYKAGSNASPGRRFALRQALITAGSEEMMDEDRVRDFETALWIGGEDVYRRSIDPECLMAVPAMPFLMSGGEAIEAVSKTPRWASVDFDDFRIGRPQEGLIVIAYFVRASREGQAYSAYCPSTYRRIAHEQWQVVQHQQSPVPAAGSKGQVQSHSDEAASGDGRSDAMQQAQKEASENRENEHGYQ